MIKRRVNPKSDYHGLQLTSPDDGCCPGANDAACLYRFQWGTTPSTIGDVIVTIDGVNHTIDLDHTYTTTQALYEALWQLFTKSTLDGGFGSNIESGDIRVYMDKYIGIAGNTDLTVEIISTYPIVSITTNLGTLATSTPQCDSLTMCEYRGTFEDTDNFRLAIGNVVVVDTTYATGLLLRTGVQAGIVSASLSEEAKFIVNVPSSGTTSNFKLYVKQGLPVFIDGVVATKTKCSPIYLNQ